MICTWSQRACVGLLIVSRIQPLYVFSPLVGEGGVSVVGQKWTKWTKMSYNDCIRVAQDRERWRSMTADLLTIDGT